MVKATLTVPTATFSRIRGALTDTSGALDAVGYYVVNKWMPPLFKSAGQGTWAAVGRGGPPLWDTGTLARGFSYALGMDRKSVVIVNPMKYAALQNFGGTVSAKGGKFLAIPMPNLSVSERRSKPRDFSNTFFAKSRKGNLILFQKTGGKKSEGIRPLFAMKTSVTIKPRLFMKWFPEMKAQAIAIARAEILKTMKAA
jgi:hypothetical protein